MTTDPTTRTFTLTPEQDAALQETGHILRRAVERLAALRETIAAEIAAAAAFEVGDLVRINVSRFVPPLTGRVLYVSFFEDWLIAETYRGRLAVSFSRIQHLK